MVLQKPQGLKAPVATGSDHGYAPSGLTIRHLGRMVRGRRGHAGSSVTADRTGIYNHGTWPVAALAFRDSPAYP